MMFHAKALKDKDRRQEAGETENRRNGGLEKAVVGDRKSAGGVPY